MAQMCNTAIMMVVVLRVTITKLSAEPQHDDAGADNPPPRLEKQTRSENTDMPHSEPDSRLKVIFTRSGQVSHRPKRLGIAEEL